MTKNYHHKQIVKKSLELQLKGFLESDRKSTTLMNCARGKDFANRVFQELHVVQALRNKTAVRTPNTQSICSFQMTGNSIRTQSEKRKVAYDF